MKAPDTSFSSDSDIRKILLTGDINSAFLDADALRELPCEVQADISEAIEAAAKNSFAAIGVVMSGMPTRLSSTLKALRQTSPDTKIILLAQMHQEPEALQLVSSTCNGAKIADDYLICPIQTSRFHEYIKSPQSQQAIEPHTTPAVDEATERKIKHLEELATTDELTGLKNRRYIWEFSRQIIEHTKRENGRVTLLVFDIDNFKHYNDIYGHCAGDEILIQAAALMQWCCRKHDVVGRIGGDEFAVVFWDEPKRKAQDTETERRSTMADHPKEVIFIAKRLRRELTRAELPSLGPEGKGTLTISGGLASFPYDGMTIDELFAQADKALLEAKRSGKNRIYLVGKPESDIADIE